MDHLGKSDESQEHDSNLSKRVNSCRNALRRRNRSGSANLNSAIGGNSGHEAGPSTVWREGVFDGKQFEVHPTQITQCKQQLLEGASNVYGAGAQPEPVDLAPRHAKIGQLALENDFLEGALTKAGLPSEKR